MYSVIFKGFETEEQAMAFIQWYSGQGEQQSAEWLEEHSDIQYTNVDRISHVAESKDIIVDLILYKS